VKSGLQFGDEADTPAAAPKVEPQPPTDDGAVAEVEDPTVPPPSTNGSATAVPDPNAPVRPLTDDEPAVPAEPD
jgi:hypothetical protein